ncbi:hypothetical protein HanPSC8_Chr08g0308461 [Helianthus annuus]|nr:hypothetical protein HanPSC8_Chr08g0308461 [Helianthus annuus]
MNMVFFYLHKFNVSCLAEFKKLERLDLTFNNLLSHEVEGAMLEELLEFLLLHQWIIWKPRRSRSTLLYIYT